MAFSPDPIQKAVPAVIDWFGKNKRDLPWRREPTAYHIWISEIMLQQTRIEAVIPYYFRFLEALPTVRDLAQVPDDVLMKLWQGLGYYSRARNLKKAAAVITDEYGGVLPQTAAELKKLPGIGDYTAGAIASLAYGCPEPAVDGNVMRVCMRLTGCDDDVMQPSAKQAVTAALKAVYPSGNDAALLTQGLMELGEVVCIPNGTPLCLNCPLREICVACREGRAGELPVRSAKKSRRIEEKTVFLLQCGDKYALSKRPPVGLLADLWEFPNVSGHLSPGEAAAFADSALVEPLGAAKHIFTHIEWHMVGYRVILPEQTRGYVWAAKEEILEQYAVPTAFKYYIAKL